jgi:hypothetical protein
MEKARLEPVVKTLLLLGVNRAGSYCPEDVLLHIEEAMNLAQYNVAVPFLRWAHATGEKFGTGNIEKQYAKYLKWRDKRERE